MSSTTADRSATPVSVVVVDDDPGVRVVVRTALSQHPRIDVIGEGEDGLQAIRLAQQLTPDIMLLDVSMPRLDGIGAARRIRTVSPRTRVVMYTAHDDPGLSEQALNVGARGVLSKSHPVEVLADDLIELRGAEHDPSGAPPSSEDELHRSEERFRLLVEAVEDYAIFMLDPAGVIASWNSGAQRIKGYTASEIIGRHFRVFYPEDKQQSAHPEFELVQALAEGHFEEEGWRVRKDGSLMWANVLITPVYDNEGKHIGFAKVTRDISDRRRQEAQREQAAEELAAANDQLVEVAVQRAEFLAVTAHELKTPINVISGSASTLNRYWKDLSDFDREELLGTINSSVGRLNRLLNDLLTAAKLESGSVRLNLGKTPLGELLEEAVASARANYGDQAPELEIHDDLTVVADRDRIAQAVDNLIQNAYRHGKPPVYITLRKSGDHAEIVVRDSGAGVSADAQVRVFDRYVTEGGSRTTGLGLYIVRELARAHGGEAAYEPAEGTGAAFVISLPLPEEGSADAG